MNVTKEALMTGVEAALGRIAFLEKENAILLAAHQKQGAGWYCVYCQIDLPDMQAMVMHDETCEVHPWRVTDKELAEALTNYERADQILDQLHEMVFGPDWRAKDKVNIVHEVRRLQTELEEERKKNEQLATDLANARRGSEAQVSLFEDWFRDAFGEGVRPPVPEEVRQAYDEFQKGPIKLKETEKAAAEIRHKNEELVGWIREIRAELAMDPPSNVDRFCQNEIMATLRTMKAWDRTRALVLAAQAEKQHADLVGALQRKPLWGIAIRWAAKRLEKEAQDWKEHNILGHDGAVAFLNQISLVEEKE